MNLLFYRFNFFSLSRTKCSALSTFSFNTSNIFLRVASSRNSFLLGVVWECVFVCMSQTHSAFNGRQFTLKSKLNSATRGQCDEGRYPLQRNVMSQRARKPFLCKSNSESGSGSSFASARVDSCWLPDVSRMWRLNHQNARSGLLIEFKLHRASAGAKRLDLKTPDHTMWPVSLLSAIILS